MKVKHMYIMIWLVNNTLSFYVISLQHEFLIIKIVVSGKNSVIFLFFIQTQLQQYIT